MRKVIVLALIVFLANTSLKAQVTPFKFEIGGLYGLPTDKDFYTGGVGFYAHPSYYLGDKINIGIKAESVIIGGVSQSEANISVSAIGSYLITSNYYFTVSKVRPYIGLGIGLYTLGTFNSDLGSGNTMDLNYGNKFGFAPKIGLDLGHFTLNVAYNMIVGVDELLPKKDYMTAGIGLFFGGGVKGKGAKKSNKNRIISIDDDEDF